MAKLKDIAIAASVSVPLVSKVLNNRLGSTGAGEETIRTIRRIAKRMGYRKNEAAAALRTGRQGVIGVLVQRLGAAGSGLTEVMLEGVSDVCGSAGLKQQLTFYTGAEQIAQYITELHPGLVDGLIVGGVANPEMVPGILEAQRHGVPVVTIHAAAVHPDIPNVGCRDVDVARLATEGLIERGRRRIAHICASPERDRGYRQALADAGRVYDDALVVNTGGFDHRAGAAAVDHLADAGVAFDALFADSDPLAMGAMRALYRLGRDVPADVSIIGVDNSPICECSIVSLSSVSGGDGKRGRLAVEMLMDIRRGGKASSIDVDPELFVRESSL